jgi:hypothetical protein
MKELQALKRIVEKFSGVEDISVKCQESDYIAARAAYIRAASHFYRNYENSLPIVKHNILSKPINIDRSTFIYWEGKYETWAQKNDRTLLNNIKVSFLNYLEGNGLFQDETEELLLKLSELEIELKTVKENTRSLKLKEERWLENFTQEQLDNFRPRMEAYMKMNNIEFA